MMMFCPNAAMLSQTAPARRGSSDRSDSVADRFFQGGRSALGPHHQDVIGSLYLRLRKIDDRERGDLIEAAHLHSPDDPDNFEEPAITAVIRIDPHALADGIFTGEKPIGERLIDDRDQW